MVQQPHEIINQLSNFSFAFASHIVRLIQIVNYELKPINVNFRGRRTKSYGARENIQLLLDA